MRPIRPILALGAIALATACAGELPTAASAPGRTSGDLAQLPITRESPVAVLIALTPAPEGPITLDAIYHESPNNVWLNFAPLQSELVSIDGPARIQYVNGETNATGIVVIGLAPDVTLRIDFSQFDGLQTSPFIQIGPGGGCIVAGATLFTPQQGQVEIQVRLEFATGMD